MSRHAANSSSLSNSKLPRRLRFPAQALSTPSIRHIDSRRLAKVDRMIATINETCVAQSALSDRDDQQGKELFEVANRKWYAAQDALTKYADKIAASEELTPADALVLAKIADFQIVNEGSHLDITDRERNVPKAVRAILTAHGIEPTDRTAMTDEQDELDALIASRPPKPQRQNARGGADV